MRQNVVCLGLLMVDILASGLERLPSHWEETLLAKGTRMGVGGGAANSAITFARLGQEVQLVSRLGSDSFGDFAAWYLENEGVGTGSIIRDREQSTGVAMGLVHNEGKRCFITSRGANAFLNRADLQNINPEETALLHINGYFQLPGLEEDMPFLLERFKKSGTIITFDTASWDPSERWYGAIKGFAQYIDYFFANDTQLYELTGFEDMERAAFFLTKDGVKNVVAKLGDKGCTVYGEKSITHKDGCRVNAIDTTGAGDSFDAAFDLGLLRGWSTLKCASFANAVAGLNCTKLGATSGVPTFDEALRFIENM